MGFWSALGKIASIAGPIAAIPFTGGTSLLGTLGMGAKTAATLGGVLGAAGKVASAVGGSNIGQDAASIAAGRQDARMSDAMLQQRQDQLGLSRYNAGLNAADVDLARRKFQLTAPTTRAGQAVRGDILAKGQNTHITPIGSNYTPHIQSGFGPSSFSDTTRALGTAMSADALKGQQSGDTFAPLDAPPPITPLSQPNLLDKSLTAAGYFGTLAPDFLSILKKYQPPSKPATTDPSLEPD